MVHILLVESALRRLIATTLWSVANIILTAPEHNTGHMTHHLLETVTGGR